VIRVVTLSEFEDETLALVLKRLQNAYGVGAEIGRRASMPKEAWVRSADAYDAQKVLAEAEDVRAFGDDKILFLTDRPLLLPEGPMGPGPIDGFADYGGQKAVATSVGLGGKSLPVPEGLAKRATRHAGHLFGLHHCHDAKCAMLPGWAEGFALHPDTMLCPYCREKSEQWIQRT
jgi:predicted Zn-dependent protease